MSPQDDNQDYLKISEAARLIGVSQKTVYRWILAGELNANKVGGLYLINRGSLETRLAPEKKFDSTESLSKTEIIKCGSCFQIITSDAQVGSICKEDGCEQIICMQCQQKNISYCLNHRPTAEQSWHQAEEKLHQGEYKLLVKSPSARQRELIFLNRIDARLSNVKTLLHPTTGELITISSWEAVREKYDEQSLLIRLLRKLFLDASTLARYPLNMSHHYRFPIGKGQKGESLEIWVQVFSRMERMVKQQYDTEPLGDDFLLPLLTRYTEDLDKAQIFRIFLLASTTGWSENAKQLIQGGKIGTAFLHRRALVYLYDLEKGEMIFNSKDDRLSGYAELFTPTLPDEELDEVKKAIEEELITYDSLALKLAIEILPYKRSMIEAAFQKMAETGNFKIIELPQAGVALVRQRI